MTDPDLRFREASFDELTLRDLYAILRLRAEVFVVEQRCPYNDLDGHDDSSRHLLAEAAGDLVGYARWRSTAEGVVLGRIVTAPGHRGGGIGALLMDEALSRLPEGPALMHAQAHLEEFYGRWGFEVTGEPFLEDGLPHLVMIRG